MPAHYCYSADARRACAVKDAAGPPTGHIRRARDVVDINNIRSGIVFIAIIQKPPAWYIMCGDQSMCGGKRKRARSPLGQPRPRIFEPLYKEEIRASPML